MSQHALQEFFREKKHKSGGDIDWDARKRAWIDAVNRLYGQIETEYLAAPVAEGDVLVSQSEKEIVEDFMGSYAIRELVLQVGDERAVFSPKGRNIVGASGRIDLIGEMGQRTLVLQPGERWGIVVARTPTLTVAPLDETSLLDALKEVMRQ